MSEFSEFVNRLSIPGPDDARLEDRLAVEHAATAIRAALDIAHRYAGCDGERNKQWVIDQMVRALTGREYDNWVAAHKEGEDGPDTYDWDVGWP